VTVSATASTRTAGKPVSDSDFFIRYDPDDASLEEGPPKVPKLEHDLFKPASKLNAGYDSERMCSMEWEDRAAKERKRLEGLEFDPADLGYAAAREVLRSDRATVEAMLKNDESVWTQTPEGKSRCVDPLDIFEWFCKHDRMVATQVPDVYAFVCGVYLAFLDGELCSRADRAQLDGGAGPTEPAPEAGP